MLYEFVKGQDVPQILKNVVVKDDNILKRKSVKKSIKNAKKIINNYGRILVRKSGTEPKVRVMGESENIEILNKSIKVILKTIY